MGGLKGLDRPGLAVRRKQMRMMSDTELSKRSDVELAVLFGMVSNALALTSTGTPERRRVVSNLQSISRARALRHRACRMPGF